MLHCIAVKPSSFVQQIFYILQGKMCHTKVILANHTIQMYSCTLYTLCLQRRESFTHKTQSYAILCFAMFFATPCIEGSPGKFIEV